VVDERRDAHDHGDDGDLDVEADQPAMRPLVRGGDRSGVGEDEGGDGQKRERREQLGGDEDGEHRFIRGRTVCQQCRSCQQRAGERQHRDTDGADDKGERQPPLAGVGSATGE
jgi:hypothetical protein